MGEEPHLVLQAPAGFLGPLSPPHSQLFTQRAVPTGLGRISIKCALAQVCSPGRVCSFPQAGALPHLFRLLTFPCPCHRGTQVSASVSTSGKLLRNDPSYPSKGIPLRLTVLPVRDLGSHTFLKVFALCSLTSSPKLGKVPQQRLLRLKSSSHGSLKVGQKEGAGSSSIGARSHCCLSDLLRAIMCLA